ncbi:MAG: hypothetical protein NTX03_13740 [Bacteroidetes bacterium]|nr:hypothetical protein [Bacteroidota bacterium]
MNENVFLMNLILVAIPMGIVTVLVVLMLGKHFENEAQKRKHEFHISSEKVVLPIRLQAYERLTLLLERISVQNIILRVKRPGMDAADLYSTLVHEIRAEFEHNLSQQIYVTPETWDAVQHAKEDTIKMINIAFNMLPEDASALDFSKVIFDQFMKMEHPPSYTALLHVKREVVDLF